MTSILTPLEDETLETGQHDPEREIKAPCKPFMTGDKNPLAIKGPDMARVALEDTWPEPDLSVLSIEKQTPTLPIERFGSWAEWIKLRAEESTAPLDYIAFGFLTVAGSLLGNRRWVKPRPKWKEPPIIWTILIGEPSFKKSPALDCVTEIVDVLEDELQPKWEEDCTKFKTDEAVAAAHKDAWLGDIKKAAKKKELPPTIPDDTEEPQKPIEPIFRTADATAAGIMRLLKDRPEGILLSRDELSGWLENLGAYNSNDAPFYIEAYGGRDFRQARSSKDSFSGKVKRVSVSVLGGIQPDKLKPLLLSRSNDGMASRFCMIWPERPVFGFSDGTTDPEKAVSALRKLTRLKMVQGEQGPEPEYVPFTAAAFEIFKDWSQGNYHRASSAHGKFKGFLGKLDGMVVRLSLILEFLEWAASDNDLPPKEVGEASVINATFIVDDYLVPMTDKAYGAATLSENELYAHELLNHIIESQITSFNAREWYRSPPIQGMSSTEKIYAGLSVLAEARIVKEVAISPGRKGGRPAKDYIVSPKLWEKI